MVPSANSGRSVGPGYTTRVLDKGIAGVLLPWFSAWGSAWGSLMGRVNPATACFQAVQTLGGAEGEVPQSGMT